MSDSIIERVARLLPAQGPISVFIHHNPLHAFEHLPFEAAASEAGALLGCEALLDEEAYRAQLERGRITEHDLREEIRNRLGRAGDEPVPGGPSRLDWWVRLVRHGIPDARGRALDWLLEETAALVRLRPDRPIEARELLDAASSDEARLVGDLWRACLAAVARIEPKAPAESPAPTRPRDLLLAAHGIDVDEWIHPLLIRFVGSYLDQGLAHWSMPDRERGLYHCFVSLYGGPNARHCGAFAGDLPALIQADLAEALDGTESLDRSLAALGVSAAEKEEFLLREALALRGWAGMVRQLETRPDRVPGVALPARLVDFLAVRLLLTRSALAYAVRQLGQAGPIVSLRDRLRAVHGPSVAPTPRERAWALFHAAQLAGLTRADIDGLSDAEASALEQTLEACDSDARRSVWHAAFERHLRHRLYDALCQHAISLAPASPLFQVIHCIDEREESFRRHLEEIEPGVETFGTAGFFGIPMYYRGASDAQPRPLCPVAVRPTHTVEEIPEPGREPSRWRRWRRRASALVDKNVHVGSRTLFRGTAIMAALGVLWSAPLVLRVLFPWLRHRLARDAPPATLLSLASFSVGEMAAIVGAVLEGLGRPALAELVLILGHGSTSLNNPHESAHDCGACGGGRGGPNARAFAQMANDPGVRAALAEQGVDVPATTWFVGGERNTASNAVVFFDVDRVPEASRARLGHAHARLDQAREREAHERCRRFDASWTALPPRRALNHVEARSADLAQPRPEYGHATNAFCIVGRRARTRGLFLDRRAFLVSYDPERDAEGAVLARTLAAVVPVVAGISLEYFFGYVDPTGYGSGTKLPHNVTGLLGVMDGAQSDLRTGLPWQMLEIHEPVRLTLVVESEITTLTRVLREDPGLSALVDNEWLHLACLAPDGPTLHEIGREGPSAYRPEHPHRVVRGDSAAVYAGRSGHLPFPSVQQVALHSLGESTP